MSNNAFGRILAGALVLGLAVSTGASFGDAGQKGRYKKEGAKCVWNADDSGPNQCTPTTTGRFKKSGDNCTWDVNDSGADQCRPAKGRFKKEGNACVWNASDGGPDQCDPRQAK